MSLPICRVTVTEDRALVVREGSVTLAAGTQRVRVEDVAPALVDKSVRVTVLSGAARAGEARVVRERSAVLPEDPSARTAAQALDAELEAAYAELERLAASVTCARGELALLEATARATLGDVSWNAAHDTKPDGAGLEACEAREKELAAELVRLALDERERREAYERLRARRAAADHPATRERAALELVVSVDAAGEARVAVEYVVPGACWRPHHTATLVGEELTVATDACVWQNTGEAWDDVELRFSTERPSLGREPPRLSDDRLAAVRKQDVLRVESRDEQIQKASVSGVATRTDRVPGIDDGGEARVLVARERARVPTDGRPHRVLVGTFVTPAKLEAVCAAQVVEALVLRTEQTNRGKVPLLAGPVDLVRRGGFVGRSKVPFVAAGEAFELGWGPDPGVRVRHEVEQVEEEPGVFSGWLARSVRERVHVSGLDDSKRAFTLTLRVPVSELEKVQIVQDLPETTGKAKVDDDGFVRWTVDLPPNGRRAFSLRYVVKRRKDVVGL